MSLATSGSIVHCEEKAFLTTLIGRVDLWVFYAAFRAAPLSRVLLDDARRAFSMTCNINKLGISLPLLRKFRDQNVAGKMISASSASDTGVTCHELRRLFGPFCWYRTIIVLKLCVEMCHTHYFLVPGSTRTVNAWQSPP